MERIKLYIFNKSKCIYIISDYPSILTGKLLFRKLNVNSTFFDYYPKSTSLFIDSIRCKNYIWHRTTYTLSKPNRNYPDALNQLETLWDFIPRLTWDEFCVRYSLTITKTKTSKYWECNANSVMHLIENDKVKKHLDRFQKTVIKGLKNKKTKED